MRGKRWRTLALKTYNIDIDRFKMSLKVYSEAKEDTKSTKNMSIIK